MENVKLYKNTELINEDFSQSKLPKIRKDFIAKLENALMFLDYKDLNMWHSESKNSVSINNFDGSWLLDISLKHGEHDTFAFSPFGELQVTPDMFPKLNIKMLNLGGEIASLSKYRFLDIKEKRNLEPYKYIFSERFAFLDYGKQKWWTNEEGYGFNKVSKTDDHNIIVPIPTSLKAGYYYDKNEVSNRIQRDLKDSESMYMQTIKNFHMALQLSLTYDYEWSCYIKENEKSLGVRIPIHPSSSKDVFQLRNVPDGKIRKTAILNFVKDHYRTLTDVNNEEKKVLIAKHLRGELKFNWRGLEVHIIPSPYDLRKIKTSKKIINLDN